jgi:DNA-binding response OmpR family regulator
MTQKVTVILAEGDVPLRDGLARLLERHGYKVIEADDGHGALLHLSKEPADLVILDMLMPWTEGAETITTIHRDYPAVKILATCGGGMNPPEDYLKLARVLGAHLVLAKPWDPTEFLAAVVQLVGETHSDVH